MSKDAIVIGYSGHGFVLIDILLSQNINVVGYCDNEEKTSNPYDLQYIGFERNERTLKKLKENNIYIGIGDNLIRSGIFEFLIKEKVSCPSVSHSSSIISSQARIGSGTIIMPNAVINSKAEIGNAVICNSSCVIEHECFIGNYTHIAPATVLAGNVIVGNNSFIGANSVIKQGVKIGSNVTIGAGSVVIKNILDNQTVYGNPAR